MRGSATFLLLILFCLSAKAQLNKGQRQLGGVIGASSSKIENSNAIDAKSTSIQVQPSIGKFYRDRRLVGIHLSFLGTFYPNSPDAYGLGGGLFLRQYKELGKSGLFIFAHENLSYFHYRYYNTPNGERVPMLANSISAGIVPAFAYSATKRLQLELSIPELATIQYYASRPRDKDDTRSPTNKSFSFSTGLSTNILNGINAGISWLF
jgi:hypothetical protein